MVGMGMVYEEAAERGTAVATGALVMALLLLLLALVGAAV